MDWKDQMRNPPEEYRAIPFWALNDKLNDDELRWQIGQMKEAGLGGYFMHARSGLKTPYMSDEWLQAIEVCVEEGKRQGISPWLYDENGWPSGFADGKVPGLGIDYQQKWLECRQLESDNVSWTDRTIGIYILGDSYRTFRYASGQESIAALGPKEVMLHIGWVNNPYYVDVLNEQAIRSFIDNTHEVYYERMKDSFGSVIKGIFTDEPQYASGKIPWSFSLAEQFENEHGYSIISVLPALFYKVEGYQSIRYDFWKTVNRLFTEAFSKQIGDWCRNHSIVSTGHVMSEDNMMAQMKGTAGAMPFYHYMQMPGIDWLLRRIGGTITVKQVSSVAHQLGQKHIISEMFGCSGWNISFEELKWIAEWQYVLGVNTMCQHLEWYSMKGLRKRDYPPSLFYQQPWWPDYKLFNDYFARLSLLLTEGRHICNVLVLHPLHSAWMEYSPIDNESIKKLDKALADVSRWLMELHIDYDYGDESILSEYADVDGHILAVGKARYKAVVIPPAFTLDKATVRLLRRFVQSGGRVISIGNFPMLVNGRDSDDLVMLRSKVKCIEPDKRELKAALSDLGLNIYDQNGDDASHIYVQQRYMDDGQRLIFAVNISQTDSVCARIALDGIWYPKLCRLENGEYEVVPADYAEGSTSIELNFMPMQSYAILLDKKGTDDAKVISRIAQPEEIPAILTDQWHIELEDYNALTLDYACISIDAGPWSEMMPVIAIQDMLLRMGRAARVALKFSFICCGINEVILRTDFEYSDDVYQLLMTPDIHESQTNKITYDTEIESIYLLGHFGVYSMSDYGYGDRRAVFADGPFICRQMPATVTTGDLSAQGLAFYAGNVRLIQHIDVPHLKPGQRIYLDLCTKPDDVLTKVWINEQVAGNIPWTPYKIDITDALKNGQNTLAIELMGSCRNLLGPHHHITGELYAVGPSSFTNRKGWTDADTDCDDIWTDRYCFTRFGLSSQPKIMITS
ncbi:glycosyl hydrolase [Mahella sp.]|uniref:glycosyl hydrolase n=1 Tax=Mahella sp. TaxID=2798721 RepID=UPI0025C1AB2C|nr:glycosyl hydrolase [Mahella sp.]MBZ4666767.1 hypothetical protein [Mahella sp.]